MRKLLLSFLLATTAATVSAPALAQRPDRDERSEEREQRRAERAESRQERSEAREARRESRQARPEPSEVREQRQAIREQINNVHEQRAQHVEQAPAAHAAPVNPRERRRANVNERGRPTLHHQERENLAVQHQGQRDRFDQRRQESRERYAERSNQRRLSPPAGARPDRPAPPPQTTTNHRSPQWSTTHWRRDGRYDWRRHRDRNRSHFRLGIYFDPFGWNYRRYNIGWRLWPAYYSNHYWLNDPWSYRLPYAPWPYRWVRYYDDAILVNTITGQVADVIYDFFW